MAVLTTRHGRTEMRCINLPATNETLVIAPKYKGTRVQIIVGGMVAEEITTDKKARSTAFKQVKSYYDQYKEFIVAVQ